MSLYNFSLLNYLIVDPSFGFQQIVKNTLRAVGCRDFVAVPGGEMALDHLRRGDIDLVIAEWSLLDIDGEDFVKRIRRGQAGNPFVPIVVLTGLSRKEIILRARDAGATEFLVKPISPKTLLGRIVHIAERPRPFVRVDDGYIGPCRRRHDSSFYQGIERRGTEVDLDFAAADESQAAAE